MSDDEKPHVAFYLYGEIHGMGKGLLARTIEEVFGHSAVIKVIDQNALNSMSAVDVWTRTWTIVEEVDVKTGSADYNKLKTMIGGSGFNAARKGEHFRRYETPAQLVMLSNHAPNFIEPNDRRFFISKWQKDFPSQEAKDDYFNEYVKWLTEEDGFAHIAGLLAKRDVQGVRVESPAMMTEEKLAVTTLLQDAVVEEIREHLEAAAAAICFTRDSFYHIWKNHEEIKTKQYKYKLQDAGLIIQRKKKFEGQWREFWLRPGWKLQSKPGTLQTLVHTDGRIVLLKDDPGYRNSVGSESDL